MTVDGEGTGYTYVHVMMGELRGMKRGNGKVGDTGRIGDPDH